MNCPFVRVLRQAFLPAAAFTLSFVPSLAADPDPDATWQRDLAEGRRHGALQNPVSQPAPPVNDAASPRTDIDRFLPAAMERAGVKPVAVVGILLAAFADAPPPTEGPHEVAIADGLTLRDAARGKDLPYKVSFPKEGGPSPLLVFSHGFGGNKDAFSPVSRHWASHGYVVIQPTHADGLGRRGGDRNAPGTWPARRGAGGLLAGLNDPNRIADRIADLVLILDSLAEIAKATPGLEGRIDAKRIGVGGHSFGAYTAMLIGGVTVDLGGEQGRSFRDRRVTCILPVSAQGTGQQGLTEASWTGLTIPMMTITGTRDQGVGGQGVEWKREPYRFSPPGSKYLVVIDGANHFSFGGGLGPRSSGVTDVVNMASTLFWDAFLKDSQPARTLLDSERLPEESGGGWTLETK
jgi:predicted dienelactone hydrolase